MYVGLEEDIDEAFPVSDVTIESFNDGEAIGVYELREVVVKRIEHTISPL